MVSVCFMTAACLFEEETQCKNNKHFPQYESVVGYVFFKLTMRRITEILAAERNSKIILEVRGNMLSNKIKKTITTSNLGDPKAKLQ